MLQHALAQQLEVAAAGVTEKSWLEKRRNTGVWPRRSCASASASNMVNIIAGRADETGARRNGSGQELIPVDEAVLCIADQTVYMHWIPVGWTRTRRLGSFPRQVVWQQPSAPAATGTVEVIRMPRSAGRFCDCIQMIVRSVLTQGGQWQFAVLTAAERTPLALGGQADSPATNIQAIHSFIRGSLIASECQHDHRTHGAAECEESKNVRAGQEAAPFLLPLQSPHLTAARLACVGLMHASMRAARRFGSTTCEATCCFLTSSESVYSVNPHRASIFSNCVASH